AGTHGLHRLAFSAVGSGPQLTVIEFSDGIAGIAQHSGDGAVAGGFFYEGYFPAFELPADFCGKLKLVAAVVNGPGTVGFHEDAVLGVTDEIVEVPSAGEQADVGHANDGEAVPAFSTHGSGGAVEANEVGGFAIRKIAAELPVLDDVGALRGDTFVVVGEGAEALAVVETGVGDYVDDTGGVFEIVQLIEGEKTGA